MTSANTTTKIEINTEKLRQVMANSSEEEVERMVAYLTGNSHMTEKPKMGFEVDRAPVHHGAVSYPGMAQLAVRFATNGARKISKKAQEGAKRFKMSFALIDAINELPMHHADAIHEYLETRLNREAYEDLDMSRLSTDQLIELALVVIDVYCRLDMSVKAAHLAVKFGFIRKLEDFTLDVKHEYSKICQYKIYVSTYKKYMRNHLTVAEQVALFDGAEYDIRYNH